MSAEKMSESLPIRMVPSALPSCIVRLAPKLALTPVTSDCTAKLPLTSTAESMRRLSPAVKDMTLGFPPVPCPVMVKLLWKVALSPTVKLRSASFAVSVTAVLKVASSPTVMVMADCEADRDRTLLKVASWPTVMVPDVLSLRLMPLKVTPLPAVTTSVPGEPVMPPTKDPSPAVSVRPVDPAALMFNPSASTAGAMLTVALVFGPKLTVAGAPAPKAVRFCSKRTSTGVGTAPAALIVMLALTAPSMMKMSPGWAAMGCPAPICG